MCVGRVPHTAGMSSFSPGADPSRRLPPRPESVRSARQFVRAAANGAAPDLVATAELLVSELVTNAVVHAHTDIEVRVSFRDGRIRIQVTDVDRSIEWYERHFKGAVKGTR